MGTPGTPESGVCYNVYGADEPSINRRTIIGGFVCLSVSAPVFAAPADPLAAALRAGGGKSLLSRVKALAWEGRATIVAGGRSVEIGVETRVEPFVRARSNTWILSQGKAATRALVIEPGAGYTERDGKRTPLPLHQARHERQQFGLYGYMLLARAPTMVLGGKLHAAREGFPPVRFDTAPDGRLTGADYMVDAPDGGDPIRERFSFAGVVRDQGVSWPREIRIAQDGTPFFTLVIERFRVEV